MFEALPLILLVAAVLLGRQAYQGFRTADRERRSWVGVLGSDPTPIPELVAMARAADSELGSWQHFFREVTISGLAESMPDRDMHTPVSHESCVWYHFRREQRTVRRSDGEDRVDTELEHESTSGGRFPVVDGGARVIVEVSGADVREVPSTVRIEPEEITPFHRLRGIRKLDSVVTERFIRPGDLVTVAGTARATVDGVSILGDEVHPVVISGEARSDLLRARQDVQLSVAWTSLAEAGGAVAALVAAVLFW